MDIDDSGEYKDVGHSGPLVIESMPRKSVEYIIKSFGRHYPTDFYISSKSVI